MIKSKTFVFRKKIRFKETQIELKKNQNRSISI